MHTRPGVVATPLVGRESHVAHVRRRLDEAANGRGQLLLLAGEAGIGKTRLLAEVADLASASGFQLLRMTAFPGDETAAGGLLLDLATQLRQSAVVGGVDAARRLHQLLGGQQPEGGDAHRRRRLLIHAAADALLDVAVEGRLLWMLEDLHWADSLSLDVFATVATRLPQRSHVIVAAFRLDELFDGTPMREWRGRLLTQRVAEEMRLPRLELRETSTLAAALLGRPLATAEAMDLLARSDGIPLHIEELLAASSSLGTLGAPTLHVPDNLAAAILSRAATLDRVTRQVAGAAAVIGRSFDFDLLVGVAELAPETVDRCLRELRSMHFVQPGTVATTFGFRHALIRDALFGDLPLPVRRMLHQRVALAAVDRGFDNGLISAHFEEAGLPQLAHARALLAARVAAEHSSHREALELYRRAVRTADPGLAPDRKAELLAATGREAVAVDENAAAADALTEAHRLWTLAGDIRAAVAVVPALVAVEHLLGASLDARCARLTRALESLDEVTNADDERSALLSALAAAYMLDRRLVEAVEHARRSDAYSASDAGGAVQLNTATTLGSVLVFAGQLDDGWQILENAVRDAAAAREEAEAARAYRVLGSCASVLVEYERAVTWLSSGIAYAQSVELWNHRNYMTAHLAHVQWATGDWQAASANAQLALADGRGGLTTRITALYVLGYVALGRGELDAAQALLGEALAHSEGMAELQRLSPPLWGLAETALLRGDPSTAADLCARGVDASAVVDDAAYAFPFVVTGVRSLLALGEREQAGAWVSRLDSCLRSRAIPGTLPALAHARGLIALADADREGATHALGEAHAGWAGRARFWEGTWSLVDLGRCEWEGRHRSVALTHLGDARSAAERAGAASIVAAVDAVTSPPARGKAATRWDPLTAREFAVARLLAEGLTNRQIAERLVVAPKTVSAHVEHILAKLGAAHRTEIAAWAARIPT